MKNYAKYVVKLDTWVHSSDAPLTTTYSNKKKSEEFIKKILNRFPYVKATLKVQDGSIYSLVGIYQFDKKGHLKIKK